MSIWRADWRHLPDLSTEECSDADALPCLPWTSEIDAEKTIKQLAYAEMIALARMYERWAHTEERLTPEQRTKLIVWSSDYERLAEHVGEGWSPSGPQSNDPIAFVARQELRATR